LNKTSLHCLQIVQNAGAWLLTKSTRRPHIIPILLPRTHSYTSRRSLRSSGQRLLEVPRTHLRTRGDRDFQVVAPKLWNELPYSLCSTDSEAAFKRQLQTFLFRQAFG
ncbi:hypothetical protein LDENG_00099060, partial [Lucifuga dentata]